MRRVNALATAGAALASCALLGACGGSGHESHAGVKHAAAPRPAPTRTDASAFARAVNLTREDVPGFTATPRHQAETPREKQLQAQLRACVGSVRFGGGLLEESSPDFRLKHSILDFGVSSEVAVARSAALAAGELSALRAGRVRGCFSRYLDLLLAGQRQRGAKVSPVSIATGTPPAPGADGSFGWRISASFTLERFKLSLYVDILGFIRGPARVTLVSSGVLRPFPAAIQQQLFTLLLARATARAL
jgi:hypothetical protein